MDSGFEVVGELALGFFATVVRGWAFVSSVLDYRGFLFGGCDECYGSFAG